MIIYNVLIIYDIFSFSSIKVYSSSQQINVEFNDSDHFVIRLNFDNDDDG